MWRWECRSRGHHGEHHVELRIGAEEEKETRVKGPRRRNSVMVSKMVSKNVANFGDQRPCRSWPYDAIVKALTAL